MATQQVHVLPVLVLPSLELCLPVIRGDVLKHLHSETLTVVRLPAYAPDLNPVEFVWGNIQGQELTNLCSAELASVVHKASAEGTETGASHIPS